MIALLALALLLAAPELRLPADASRVPVTRAFGARVGDRHHTGVDLALPCGTPLHAPGVGEVVSVTRDDPAGNGARQLITKHRTENGDVFVLMAHLSTVAVSVGPIPEGQRVGNTGATGEGCHLHLAVRIGSPPGAGLVRRPPKELGYLDPLVALRP